MIIYLWRKVKTIPYLREIIAEFYYFYQKTRKNIHGNNNVINIKIQNNFPLLKNVTFNIHGNDNSIIINSGVRINNTKIIIQGNNSKLILEENCQIAGGCLWLQDDECKLVIGKLTTIAKANIGVAEPKSSISIGEDCMLSHGIDIRCSDSHSIIDLSSNKRINYAEDIKIDDHVWIAANVQILKGVHIGKNSIIAAGAIVTKDVSENSIAAGIPAQVKRTNVTWFRENIFRTSHEYNLDSFEGKN